MDERYISDLTIKSEATSDDYIVIETEDGTKLTPVNGLKKAVLNCTIFPTTEAMKSASLSENDICLTYGRYSSGDGGGGTYVISYLPSAVEDGGLIHYLHTSDTLRAQLIPQEYVTPEQFGAYGDGIKDDTKAVMNAINSGYEVKFNSKNTYRITSSIKLKSGMHLDFNHCTIKPINCSCFAADKDSDNISIHGICCDLSYGIEFISFGDYSINNLKITDFYITNASYSIFKLSGESSNIIISKGTIKGSSYVGIDIVDTVPQLDCTIDKVRFEGFLTGINIQAQSVLPSSINIANCKFFGNSSNCVGVNIGCSVFSVCINNTYAKNVIRFLNIGVGLYNNISFNNFSGVNCNTVIVNAARNGAYLTISGYMVDINERPQDTSPNLFMSGYCDKTVLDALFDETMKLFVTATSASIYKAEIDDRTDPRLKPVKTIINGSTIDVVSILGNAIINLNGATPLTDIYNGVNGQRLVFTSDTNVVIKDGVNIILKNGDATLSNNNSIELVRLNNKWVQL